MLPTKKKCSRNSTTNKNRNRNVTRTSHVRFCNSTQFFFVPGLWEFSQEEIETMWLTEEDNAKIQHITLKTLKRMRKGKNIDEKKYSARGLEHMRTSDHVEQKRINKASVRDAVLAEQRRQRQSGCYDPMKIANQSMIHSKISIDAALRLGASDAAAAAVIRLKRDPSGGGDNVIGERNESCSVDQNIERSKCISILEEAMKVTDSSQTNERNKAKEPCLPSDISRVEWKSDASRNTKEKVDDLSRNVFNRVLSKFSLGLEVEANYTKAT